LLSLLASDNGRVVSIDRIVDELWTGDPPPSAEATLRTYVSRLRRVIGVDAVVARSRGYSLEVEPECIDARRFERLLAEGRCSLEQGAAGAAADRLTAALDLWRGPAYGDVGDTGSLAVEARRLEELRLECVEQRVAASLVLGRHEHVVSELQSLVREHPWRERLWRHLIVALYRSGRQADALAAYQEARERLESELGLDPGEELQQLERDVLRHEVATVVTPKARHNVPAMTTRLIGRDSEVGEIQELLREHRLVVLTGLGGSGKTRLAVEIAHRQVASWTHGVWLVDLAALSDPRLVPSAVAGVLSVGDTSRAPLESLVEHLRGLELLVVLDNCEHLVDACAEVTTALLHECAHVRVLATSRVPLGVYGELDYALDPLAAPEPDAGMTALRESPAVQLFCERAVAVRRDVLRDDNALGVAAAICRDLDGLPLAIELAAARAKALPLHEVSTRLDDRFRFLRAWQRVTDPRHATLQTTMDWSYRLLGDEEQTLLRRLAAFSGGAQLDAVVKVCGEDDDERVVELLERLVDASMLQVETGTAVRYRMLETVRQYAATKLAEDPQEAVTRRRHAEHFLGVALQANLSIESLGKGPQRPDLVVAEQHNLRAALDWCATADVELALRIMVALENFWVTHALAEWARRYDDLLPRAVGLDTRLRARAELDRGAAADIVEDFDRARESYARSRALFAECGDDDGVASAEFRLGLVTYLRDHDVEQTRAMWEQCLATWQRVGNEVGVIQALGNLGGIAWENGDRDRGRALVEETTERARAIGWWWWVGLNRIGLAEDALDAGEPDEAERQARDALQAAIRAANRQTILYAVAVLARAAAMRGDPDRAADLWSAVEPLEDSPGRFGRFDREAYRAAIPSRPGRAPLALDEAVALALN